MTDIDTIVVPLDGSPVAARAVPVAKHIAEMCGGTVTLVTSTWNGQGATDEELREAAAQVAPVECRTALIADRPPAEAATDLALAEPGRLLCISTHGRGGLRRVVLGSVAAEIIRAGLVPVLVIGPSCEVDAFTSPGPVQACVDGSRRSSAVVRTGEEWARRLARELYLVEVSHPMDPITAPESAEMFTELIRSAGLDAANVTSGCAFNSSVPRGLICEAERVKSPLLVIEPGVRSRMARAVLGSTTLSILGDAPCPVLVLPKEPSIVETLR